MTWLERFPTTPIIVAEIGAKYAGLDTLKAMIRSAVDCGADMVKFQTFRSDTVASPDSYFDFEDGRGSPSANGSGAMNSRAMTMQN